MIARPPRPPRPLRAPHRASRAALGALSADLDLLYSPNPLRSRAPSALTHCELFVTHPPAPSRLASALSSPQPHPLHALLSLTLSFALTASAALLSPAVAWADEAETHTETECADGMDNDGDTVPDCADADCAKAPNCQKDGAPESTNARCSDWVDNDDDGVMDCEDQDCQVESITVCGGSWSTPQGAQGGAQGGAGAPAGALASGDPRDLLGNGSDVDGERNDYLCADGIDNDRDGKTDCEDLGCQLDGSVQVCRGAPNMRFSVVGQLMHSYDMMAEEKGLTPHDTRVSRLQLRTFGPIPQIENSFYLISLLAERTPRLTFATFAVPLGKSRHMISVNSGAAGLSQSAALSIHKQLLVSRTTVFRAFEQFNSAALEVTGPLTLDNSVQYRVFALGGSGRFDGNVGGRSIVSNNTNYPWGAGAQAMLNVKGYYSRFDTPFLYTPVPLTIGLLVGGKFDQREQERALSMNVQGALRWGRLVVLGEQYTKRLLAFDPVDGGSSDQFFDSTQLGYHVQAGFLAVPKYLMVAADFGEFVADDFSTFTKSVFSGTNLRKPNDERQIRGAAHFYFYRDIGVLSLVYNYRLERNGQRDTSAADGYRDLTEKSVDLVAQYRF